MERQDQAYSQGRGWVVGALGCFLLFVAVLLGAQLLGLTGARARARELMRIDTALGATLEPVDAATVRALGDGAGARGMVVTSIARGGPADSAGLRVGDLVERVQSRPADSIAAVADSLSNAPATVIINRRGNRARVEVAVRSEGLPGA
jgi:hypothetical protein